VALKLNNGLIRSFIQHQGLAAPAPDLLHLVGIRSAQLHWNDPDGSIWISVQEPRFDQYDDLIGCFGAGLYLGPGTVDPGRWYTQHPMNAGGCAHLADGGPYLFEKGLHHGLPAWRQAGGFRIRRDADRDGDGDGTVIVAHGCGIDLHRGGADHPGVDLVGRWSAGCQVPRLDTFLRLWSISERYAQREWRYWLLDGWALAKFVDGK
jgi:hypothetical protein